MVGETVVARRGGAERTEVRSSGVGGRLATHQGGPAEHDEKEK